MINMSPSVQNLLSNSNFKNVKQILPYTHRQITGQYGRLQLYRRFDEAPTNTDIKFVSVDYDFIPTYGIPMAAGRNFSREYGTDTSVLS